MREVDLTSLGKSREGKESRCKIVYRENVESLVGSGEV